MKKYKFKSDDDNDKKKINEEVLDDCDVKTQNLNLILFKTYYFFLVLLQ